MKVRGDIQRNEQELARIAEAEQTRHARQTGRPTVSVAAPVAHPEPVVFHAVAVWCHSAGRAR